MAIALDKQALIVTHAACGWGLISPHSSSGSGVRGGQGGSHGSLGFSASLTARLQWQWDNQKAELRAAP